MENKHINILLTALRIQSLYLVVSIVVAAISYFWWGIKVSYSLGILAVLFFILSIIGGKLAKQAEAQEQDFED